MVVCSRGATCVVAMTTGLHGSASTPLLKARSFRKLSVAVPMACSALRSRGAGLRVSPVLSTNSSSSRRGDPGGLLSFATPPPNRRSGRRRVSVPTRASKEAAWMGGGGGGGGGDMKPMWWWRTAACLPYFLPLHETWNYGETALFLQPHLERLEFLTNPVLEIPGWFSMLYFFGAYLWLVRAKRLPHFVRCHIMTGMLLENALQIIWTVSRWMPLSLFGVKVGVFFWTVASFAFFLCILECMRCALTGNYANLPYISDAANMQVPRTSS